MLMIARRLFVMRMVEWSTITCVIVFYLFDRVNRRLKLTLSDEGVIVANCPRLAKGSNRSFYICMGRSTKSRIIPGTLASVKPLASVSPINYLIVGLSLEKVELIK